MQTRTPRTSAGLARRAAPTPRRAPIQKQARRQASNKRRATQSRASIPHVARPAVAAPAFLASPAAFAMTKRFSNEKVVGGPGPDLGAPRGSFDYHKAKLAQEGINDPNHVRKLDNVVRGSWVDRASINFNIVSHLGREPEDIDRLNDGTALRLEPSDFKPVDNSYVPTIDELSPQNTNPYLHHNDMLRTRAQYLTTSGKTEEKDNIDIWMSELSRYVWQPTVQFYQTMPSRARIPLLDETGLSHGSGGRKSSKANASIKAGTGKMFVNGMPFTEYFPSFEHRSQLALPFYTTGTIAQFDVFFQVRGGGQTGQAEACKLAVANALQNFDPQFRPSLKVNNMLKRDPRQVERKHIAHKKARKSFAWVKR